MEGKGGGGVWHMTSVPDVREGGWQVRSDGAAEEVDGAVLEGLCLRHICLDW